MISVVVPARNAAGTIGELLAALARQVGEAPPFEVVVADNGSTDDTASVVGLWSDRLPVRRIDASARPGPSAARNIGASMTQGRFLVFTDADDVVMPGWLAAWAEASLAVAFGTGPVVSFDAAAPPPRSASTARLRAPVHMSFLPYAFGSNLGIRRDLFEQFGGFPEDWRTGEDVVLSWRVQLAGTALEFVEGAALARRTARGTRRRLRQHYAYGLSDPRMFREFGDHGIARPTLASSAKSYLGLIARLPLLVDRVQRDRWAAQAGRRAGRLVGSVKERTFYW